MLSFGDKIAIVACSDARRRSEQATIDKLMRTLEYMGLRPVMSRHIYGEKRALTAAVRRSARGRAFRVLRRQRA